MKTIIMRMAFLRKCATFVCTQFLWHFRTERETHELKRGGQKQKRNGPLQIHGKNKLTQRETNIRSNIFERRQKMHVMFLCKNRNFNPPSDVCNDRKSSANQKHIFSASASIKVSGALRKLHHAVCICHGFLSLTYSLGEKVKVGKVFHLLQDIQGFSAMEFIESIRFTTLIEVIQCTLLAAILLLFFFQLWRKEGIIENSKEDLL